MGYQRSLGGGFGRDVMSFFRTTLALACALIAIDAAHADEWTADKLRGQVLQLVDGQWQTLERGMVVPDSRVIRTLVFGRVTFTRGSEAVEIGPNTQIQIYDEGGRKPFTTVKQYFGSVSVEAEVGQVQHFAVQTPYLAAVVKGTRFTVNSDSRGASVSVQRGRVLVASYEDRSRDAISAGQSATVGVKDGAIRVSGTADPSKVLDGEDQFDPVVADAKGKTGKSSGKAKGKDKASSGIGSGSDNGNSGKGNSGRGNSGQGSSNGKADAQGGDE